MPRTGQAACNDAAFAQRTALVAAEIGKREDSAITEEQGNAFSTRRDDFSRFGNKIGARGSESKSVPDVRAAFPVQFELLGLGRQMQDYQPCEARAQNSREE